MALAEIYLLSDPRDDGPRYIGKANNAQKRMASHLREAANGRRKTPLYGWINELIALQLLPRLDVIERCRSQEWEAREIVLIADARSCGFPLLNIAKGGNAPFCPIETRRANGAKNAKARVSTPARKRAWQLRQELGSMLKRGHISEATKAKMRLRPDVFGWAKL